MVSAGELYLSSNNRSKLNDYYDDLREEKCINDIKTAIKDLKIIYHGAYEKIKIK